MADQQQRGALADIEGLDGLPSPITVDLTEKGADGKPLQREAGKTSAASPPTEEDPNVVALRQQIAESDRLRKAAERRASELEDGRRRAEEQTAEGKLSLIETSLSAATAEKAGIKRDLSAAYGAAEWDKVADLQEKLNDCQIRADRLAHGKAEAEKAARADRARSEQRERQPERRDDPVEDLIARQRITPQSADWLRRNPEFVTDPRKRRLVGRAHEDATQDEGLTPDTPAYFSFIEKQLGIGEARQEQDPPAQRQPAVRRDNPSNTAAPPSRGQNNGRGSRDNTVTLSPIQRQFCDEAGFTYEEYARNMNQLRKEGRLQ